MDKKQYGQNFFSEVKEKIEKNPKDIVLPKTINAIKIVLPKIIDAIKNEIKMMTESKEELTIEKFNISCKRLIKQIKHHIESFDIVFNLFSSEDQDALVAIKNAKEDDDISNFFRLVFNLIKDLGKDSKTKDIIDVYIKCKSEILNIKGKFDEQKSNSLQTKKNEIFLDIINKINELNEKIKSDNVQYCAADLKKYIIEKLTNSGFCDDETISRMNKYTVVNILNNHLGEVFNVCNSIEYLNASNKFVINYISNTVNNKTDLQNEILDFIKDEKKQTIGNAKQIFDKLKIELESKMTFASRIWSKLKHFIEKNKSSFATVVHNYYTTSLRLRLIDDNLAFLLYKYDKIVTELESKSDIKDAEKSINNLNEFKFLGDDLEITKKALELLRENCEKYIVKAKKHFKVIKETNVNDFSKEYNISKIKNEALFDVLKSQLSSWSQIFSEDIKVKSIEEWEKFYRSTIEGPVMEIISNIKKRNPSFEFEGFPLEITFAKEEKKK